MGKIEDLVVVKLGGSAITNKDKPLTPNLPNIKNLARNLSEVLSEGDGLRLLLIHGGGSFGHYYAKRFGLSTTRSKTISPEGIAKTSAAMVQLHSIVLDEFCNAGVYCSTILPIELFSENSTHPGVSNSGMTRLISTLSNGLVPITFGFVNLTADGSYIVSGDKIALAIARSFSVPRVVFAIDVDGVYSSPDLKGDILPVIDVATLDVGTTEKKLDVTGGIKSKISTGLEIANLGPDVYFVSGSKRGRLAQAINGSSDVLATRIYSAKKSRSHS